MIAGARRASHAHLREIEYHSLTAETIRDGFSCGDAEIDKWFRNKSLSSHTTRKHLVTCASFADEPANVIGFYALSTVVEEVSKLPGVPFFPLNTSRFFPCLQLVYMAMRTDLQRHEDSHGTAVLGEVVRTFAEIGEQIGMPAMILTPMNADASRFYKRWGFAPYDKNTKMFLPLKTALETFAAAEAEALSEGLIDPT
jgi:hypothetical protein